MKVGIVGFAGSGKSTVFQWLTGAKPDPAKAQLGQTGVAKVHDPRLDLLTTRFQPKKTTATALEFLDTPGLLPTERRDNPRRLGILRESNGLLVVLNGYSEGDAASQLRRFREELVFADLEIVTNRIGKLEDQLKKPRPAKQREADQQELTLLQRIATAFENNQSPATLGLKEDEEKAIRSFQLLTLKPEFVLVNIGDDKVNQPPPSDLLPLSPGAVMAPVKLEMELHDLPEEDRKTFMDDLGLTRFLVDDVLRAVFAAMGQIVFLTAGYDECRAWSMPAGGDAVVGAGQIHTDLARGFIRAEVLAWADFVKVYGDFKTRVGEHMKEARTLGLLREEGKTYLVQDGDIMHIRAST
jgi:ribosome-binding ATPase YchF (GTP1/OBG family)